MRKYSNQTWLKPNPALQNMKVLVGDWEMQGAHPQLPDPVRGRASFTWIEEGAFLLWETEFEQSLPPNAIAVISQDETTGSCSVLYFDARGISRIYDMLLEEGVWRTWRNAPGFLQRTMGRISADRNTITVHGELSKDGSTWEQDLDLVYTRVR
jgi:hypothetical protein